MPWKRFLNFGKWFPKQFIPTTPGLGHCLPTVDGRNPTPPRKPCNNVSPVNTSKRYVFPITIHSISPPAQLLLSCSVTLENNELDPFLGLGPFFVDCLPPKQRGKRMGAAEQLSHINHLGSTRLYLVLFHRARCLPISPVQLRVPTLGCPQIPG